MSQSQDTAKYLLFSNQCVPVFDLLSRTFRFRWHKNYKSAGLLHNHKFLQTCSFEAKRLNRTLVIEYPVLAITHNNGFQARYSWDKYISLYDSLGNAGIKFIRFHDFTKIRFQPKDIHIKTNDSNDFKTTREENEKYKLIIIKRKNPIQHLPSSWPCFNFVTYFSEEVRRIGDPVVRRLGNEFYIIHVRRGDCVKAFPEIDAATQPEAILSKIRGFIRGGCKLYIMTDGAA